MCPSSWFRSLPHQHVSGASSGYRKCHANADSIVRIRSFRSIQKRLSESLTPAEITTIEIIAPFTSGYIGFIPALEFLTTPAENGPNKFSIFRLLAWSVATCALGIVAAVPFRRLLILRERLRFPSATATGTLIGVLFGQEHIVARAQQMVVQTPESHHMRADGTHEPLEDESRNDADNSDLAFSNDFNAGFGQGAIGHAVSVLLKSLAGSSLFVRSTKLP